jgi:WD40 repeat protein
MNGFAGAPANPYVGPRAFTRHDTLFGRDVEKVNLLSIVISERVVLLYSPSGAGKTSLIQAGVIPALEAEKFRPLPIIRVNRAPSSNSARTASNRYVASALHSLAEERPGIPDLASDDLSGITMSEYLDRLDDGRESSSDAASDPVVLIFDQFEEILTVEPADLTVKDAFFAQVGEALRARHRWALFSMREEYVAALDPYLRHLPTRFATTYRLGLLEPTAARDAIQKPSALARVDFTDAAAANLIAELAKVQVRQPDGTMHEESLPYIEPVQLQVVCTRFWERLPWAGMPVHHDRPQIEPGHVEEMAQVDDALGEYYDARIATISASASDEPQVLESEIREWISAYLITERGTRAQLRVGAEREQTLTEGVIQALVDAYLIRREGRPGDRWYELAHDRLVQPIRESNAAWLRAHLEPVQLRARQWDETGRRRESLLRGGDLRRARRWVAQTLPVLPTWEQTLLTDYLDDSKTEERSRLLRFAGILAFIGLLVAVGIMYLRDVEDRRARAEEDQARAEHESQVNLTQALVSEALLQSDRGEHERGALLARQAYLVDERAGRPLWNRVDEALRQTLDAPYFNNVLRDNQGWILPVAFSPDGTRLATAGQSGTILVRNLDDPRAAPDRLEGHEGAVRALAFSPAGNQLASGGDDGRIRLWKLSQPVSDPTILGDHQGVVWSLAFTPEGDLLASGGDDGTIRLWNLNDPRAEPTSFKGDAHWVNPLAFSPDGRTLATGSRDGSVRLWDVGRPESEPLTLKGHEGAVRAVTFAPDRNLLATGGFDHLVQLWDLDTPNPEAKVFIGHEGPVTSVALSPDGHTLASSSLDGTIRLWNPDDSQIEPDVLTGHTGAVRALTIAADGRYLASAGADGTARVWALLPSRVAAVPLRAHEDDVFAVAFSSDGKRLASASADHTIRIWDPASPESPSILLMGHVGYVTSVAFNGNGRILFSSGFDGTVRRWSLSPLWGMPLFRKVSQSLPEFADYAGYFFSLAASPDGQWIAAGTWDGRVFIWNPAKPDQPLPPTSNLGGRVHTVAFSPDSRLLIIGSDSRLQIIDLMHPAAEKIPLGGHRGAVRAVAVSPDGGRLASAGSDGIVRLWDLANLDAAPVLIPTDGGWIWTLAFSPDGRLLATGSQDGLIRLWDPTRPEADPIILNGHEGIVYSVAFSPDGRTLASGGADTTVRLWISDTAALADAVCTIVRRELSEEEWQRVAGDAPYEPICPGLPQGDVVGVATTTPVQSPQPAVMVRASPAMPVGLASHLPDTLHLPQGQRFRLYDEGAGVLDDKVANQPDPQKARVLLLSWGWEENAYRIFASDDPPADAAGWVELSVDRFRSADGAAAALPYLAAARRNARGYHAVNVGLFADQTEAVAGEADNGDELTIYARRGNLLFRVTGIAPNGDPTADVVEALTTVLGL